MPTYVKTRSGTWHYKWCSFVLLDSEWVDERNDPPEDGQWGGATCHFCLSGDDA